MNIYFQTIFFPGAPRIHFIFEGIVFVRKCVNLNSLYGVPWQSKLLYIHTFFFNLQMKFYFDFEMFFFYYVVLSRVA